MAGKSTISITFKLDGDSKGFKDLAKDAEGFKKVMSETISEAQQLNAKTINFAAIATGINQAQQSIAQLQTTLKGLTDAYATQQEAETKLETVMRQRMGATDADISSIKKLASAQQDLGVIGDEVQLQGAQQIATFINERKSLETLIPAMNNLLAQQKGLNATGSDAVAIGNLIGKAMQGQTSALRRVGITFSEAEEKIMKYGNESQRSAMMAQIITNNVGNMNAELAKTDAGKQKQLENTLGDIKEKLGSLAQGAMPFVTIAANTTLALAGVLKLVAGVKAATAAITACHLRSKAASVTMVALGLRTSQTAALTRVLSATFTSGAYAATTLKIALRGLMVATGVGAAIVVVTMAIEALMNTADDAADSIDGLSDAQERAQRRAMEAEAAQKASTAVLEQNRAALEINIERLKQFKGTKAEEIKIVEEMNDTYGETMGYFSSVAEWYNALISNSEAYCRQMVVEAKTRMYANQIAEKQEKLRAYYEDGKIPGDDVQGYLDDQGVDAVTGGGGSVEAWARNTEREVAQLQQRIKDAVAEAGKISFNVKGAGTRPNLKGGAGGGKTGNGSNTDAEKTRLQELAALIDANKEKYLTASADERKQISLKIAAWEAERRQLEILQKQAERPISLDSLQDIDDELAYQTTLRKYANKENLKGIDAEIERLGKLRREMERSSHVPAPIESITTYEQLNRELEYYAEQLKTADATQRVTIQGQINQLNELKDKWDATLADLKKPAPIGQLNTIEQLDDAISYYQAKQKQASADEIANIEKNIDALRRKRAAMQRGIELQEQQREVTEIGNLSSREYKLKIRSIGFDELTAKINDLKRQLNDLDNPVTAGQRKDIESLIQVYEQWRKESVSGFETFSSGWNAVKGIGSGIESITNALEGNGNAWQTVVGIIDGFIQIYESINAIIGIINMLTTASTAHAAAKVAEGTASTVAAGAQVAEATTQEAAAAAAIPVIIANKAATASYMELASAMYFAAHASIPFAGFGIAAGFISAAVAMTQAIGLMPFADGGVVSGPTYALIGEYAGASNNPEVVAPLNKLRGMLQPQGGVGGNVRFEIEGRKLVGVMANETRVSSKSGRRTNIKV